MQVERDGEGEDYVRVADVAAWLKRIEESIMAECGAAPDNCTETKAYLYGEVCSIRMLYKAVCRWKSKPAPAASGGE